MTGKLHQFIESLMKKYFQWRYWSTLYRKMAREIRIHGKRTNGELIPYVNQPGIALSFDDSYRVREWYEYGKEMFGYYDVKVTFNVNSINPIEGDREHTQHEIDQLLELQSHGHEMAHHSSKHRQALNYSTEHGYDQWIEDEIEALFRWMDRQSHSKTKEKFKRPVSFAFPHFVYNDEMVRRLIPKYFHIVRGHLHKDHLTSFQHIGFAPSICLDDYYQCHAYFIKKIIKLTKKSGKNLILTCHSILPESVKEDYFGEGKKAAKWGAWRITPEMLRTIIDEARRNGMEFYTTAEIAGIATFIDPHMESAVREQLPNPSSRWIKISELFGIKELDLRNKGISNLDGLEYFLNLEKLYVSNNRITDFRLLKKLPKLKSVDLEDPVSAHGGLTGS